MRVRSTALVVAVLGTAGLLAACGGEDRLTRAELATKGNAVCAEVDRRFKAAFDAQEFPRDQELTPEQVQRFYQEALRIVDEAIDDLAGLEPPKGLEAAYDDALAQARTDRKALAAAAGSPEAAGKLFDAGTDPFVSTNAKLAEVGITECAEEDEGGEGGGSGTGGGEQPGGGETSTTSAG